MAMTNCRECGTKVSTNAAACPKCGSKKFKRTSVLVWIVAGIVAIGVFNALFNGRSAVQDPPPVAPLAGTAAKPAPVPAVLPVAATTPAAAPSVAIDSQPAGPYAGLSGQQVVQKAGKVAASLKGVFKPGGKVGSASSLSKADVDSARAALRAIPSADPAHRRAAEVLSSFDRIEAEAKDHLAGVTRSNFAQATEETYLKNGASVTVTVRGKDKATLHFQYALVSKAFVYQMQQSKFVGMARAAGFKKLVFTDGYNESYSLDLIQASGQ